MPRIRAESLGAHHQLMWSALISSFNELAAERDPSGITLKDVAERAGMARNTVYNYVKDKDELAAAAAQSATQSMADDIVAITREDGSASALILRICQVILRALQSASVRAALRRELSATTSIEARWGTPFLPVFEEVETLVRRGIAQGEFVEVADVALTVELLSGVIGAGATRIARGDGDARAVQEGVGSAVLRLLGAPSIQ